MPDRAFVAFSPELDTGAWKLIPMKKHADSDDAAALLQAPVPVVWRVRLKWSIAAVLAALGAPSLVVLDQGWDAAQRRLFHRIAVGVDDEDRGVRDAADRLKGGLLLGGGTGQTSLSADEEVDFGRKQVALTQEGGPLAGEAKKLKLGDALAEVGRTTEALAQGLGRATGEKRRAPSRKLRDAVAECAAAFNGVHDEIAWFISRTPPGADRDNLTALLKPLEDLLSRHPPAPAAPRDATEPPAPVAAPAGESAPV